MWTKASSRVALPLASFAMQKFLVHIAVLTSCLLLASCGNKLSPALMADKIVSKYSELAEVLLTVKDAQTAQSAAAKIDALGDDLLKIGATAKDLAEVTDRTQQRNREEYIKVMDQVLLAKDKLGPQIADDKEAMKILIEALERFEEKEASLRGVYQHLGMLVL